MRGSAWKRRGIGSPRSTLHSATRDIPWWCAMYALTTITLRARRHARGRVVDRLVEAVLALGRPSSRSVPKFSSARSGAHHRREGLWRRAGDHHVVAEARLEPEPLHAERAVLIVGVEDPVEPVPLGGLGDAPGHTVLLAMSPGARRRRPRRSRRAGCPGAVFVIRSGIRYSKIKPLHERRTGPAPALVTRAPEAEPVFSGMSPLAIPERQGAREPGLRREEVVARPVEARGPDVVPDGEQGARSWSKRKPKKKRMPSPSAVRAGTGRSSGRGGGLGDRRGQDAAPARSSRHARSTKPLSSMRASPSGASAEGGGRTQHFASGASAGNSRGGVRAPRSRRGEAGIEPREAGTAGGAAVESSRADGRARASASSSHARAPARRLEGPGVRLSRGLEPGRRAAWPRAAAIATRGIAGRGGRELGPRACEGEAHHPGGGGGPVGWRSTSGLEGARRTHGARARRTRRGCRYRPWRRSRGQRLNVCVSYQL